MYFQTGQVIFVPEWPKGEFVSILASFCVWTKSLMCKDAVNKDSTCQSIFRRLWIAKKIEDFRFPVSRPNVHLSTVPSVRTTCSSRPDAKQTSIIRPDDVYFCPNPPLYREPSVPACIRQDLSAPVQTSIRDRSASDSFQVQNMGRLIHRPDDVVSRPDALINKARIAIQISPSRRQSALVRTGVQLLWKLPIRLQPSGRLPLMVRTHA